VDVFFLADLPPILERFGNRGYRAAQLEASLIGGSSAWRPTPSAWEPPASRPTMTT
ncbi:hypothetical protein LCGC14_3013620, partial [marine sediment metagenome]